MRPPATHCPDCGRPTGRGWQPRRCREHERELLQHLQDVHDGKIESGREYRRRIQRERQERERA